MSDKYLKCLACGDGPSDSHQFCSQCGMCHGSKVDPSWICSGCHPPDTIESLKSRLASAERRHQERDSSEENLRKTIGYWWPKLGYSKFNEAVYPALGDRRAKEAPALKKLQSAQTTIERLRGALDRSHKNLDGNCRSCGTGGIKHGKLCFYAPFIFKEALATAGSSEVPTDAGEIEARGRWKAFSECQDKAKEIKDPELFEWCRAKGAEAFHKSPDAPKMKSHPKRGGSR